MGGNRRCSYPLLTSWRPWERHEKLLSFFSFFLLSFTLVRLSFVILSE